MKYACDIVTKFSAEPARKGQVLSSEYGLAVAHRDYADRSKDRPVGGEPVEVYLVSERGDYKEGDWVMEYDRTGKHPEAPRRVSSIMLRLASEEALRTGYRRIEATTNPELAFFLPGIPDNVLYGIAKGTTGPTIELELVEEYSGGDPIPTMRPYLPWDSHPAQYTKDAPLSEPVRLLRDYLRSVPREELLADWEDVERMERLYRMSAFQYLRETHYETIRTDWHNEQAAVRAERLAQSNEDSVLPF